MTGAREFYTVRPNDTLGAIANANQTSVLELTQLNRIADPDKISVGQRLMLPTRSTADAVTDKEKLADDGWGSIQLRFVDALNREIAGLRVLIDNGVQAALELVTDAAGLLPPVAVHPLDPPVKVNVERAAGGTKQVAEIKPANTSQLVTLASPKVKVSGSLRRHEGPPTPKEVPAKPKPLGQETNTRSSNGHPVHEIALECPNPQNLRLLANFSLRDFIIAAAQRGKMTPQAIAAIINAEAGTIPKRYVVRPILDLSTQKPRVGKDGKVLVKKIVDPTWHDGEWNARAAAPGSSARGLTQFLDGTWIDLALTDGTFLNAKVRKEGWLTTKTIQERTTRRVREGNKITTVIEEVPKTVPAFKGNDGQLISAAKGRSLARTLSGAPHITGRATASSGFLQKLLDLRFEPEYAIHIAVDYGMQNINRLIKDGYDINSLNDADKAKVFYMAHHLGYGDAVKFIQETISESRAQHLLEQQVGVADAAQRAKDNSDNYVRAHRLWLDEYEERKIKLHTYYCDTSGKPEARSLLAITETLKKKT